VLELGELESPVVLTSTLNVFRVADGVLDHLLGLPGNEGLASVNVLVGETNDARLNDVRARPVTPADAVRAIRAAGGGPVEEGCVGAGTGTVCFGWKGGIGTASRRVTAAGRAFVLGALVQTNFGGELRIGGVRVPRPPGPEAGTGGSCMMVLATDAPLDARQLTRLARRGVLAMARLGSTSDHGSGDYTIAFATAGQGAVPEDALSGFFRAAVDALEEAMVNSMCMAQTTRGAAGRTVPALPDEEILRVVRTSSELQSGR
jgi:D-aminopeptidase